eukprot:6209903-Pleurochrysis_carterae.AAC.3
MTKVALGIFARGKFAAQSPHKINEYRVINRIEAFLPHSVSSMQCAIECASFVACMRPMADLIADVERKIAALKLRLPELEGKANKCAQHAYIILLA